MLDPFSMLVTAVSALATANVAQWRLNSTLRQDVKDARQEERSECAERIKVLEGRVAKLEAIESLFGPLVQKVLDQGRDPVGSSQGTETRSA